MKSPGLAILLGSKIKKDDDDEVSSSSDESIADMAGELFDSLKNDDKGGFKSVFSDLVEYITSKLKD